MGRIRAFPQDKRFEIKVISLSSLAHSIHPRKRKWGSGGPCVNKNI